MIGTEPNLEPERPWIDRRRGFLTRLAVWLSLFGVIYLLRGFFLLIFLTFVFAYVQASGVQRLASKVPNRTLRVTAVFIMLLCVLIAVGSFLVPRVRLEATTFVDRFPTYIQLLDNEINDLSERYSFVSELIPHPPVTEVDAGVPQRSSTLPRHSPSLFMLHRVFSLGEHDDGQQNLRNSFDTVKNVGAYLAGIGSAFFLSLLFSFLIVLDLPALKQSALSLQRSKIAFVYDEVAPSIVGFAQTLGRAIEAQLLIALLNTLLTAAGLYLLGIGEKVAFLSMIVFLCSFIPVAGVFISSVPICLVALQTGGIGLMLLSVLLITITHMVEAYILNPRIYGHHLRMNPVVVLIILTVGGKLFHVWGLILGVPICTYIFGRAIFEPETAPEATVPGDSGKI